MFTELWKNKDIREKRVISLGKAHRSEAGRKNHSNALKKYYLSLNEDQRRGVKENLKKTWAKPKLREKILELSKKGLEKAMSPEGRQNRALTDLRPETKYKRSRAAIERQKRQPKVSFLSIRFGEALNNSGLIPLPEQEVGSYVVDFLFPIEKFIIEIDGDYWHANPLKYDYTKLNKVQNKVVNKDKVENKYCQDNGYTMLRFWEQDINKDINSCVAKVKETYSELKR
jgi:very-short-patch-repair endonuclease